MPNKLNIFERGSALYGRGVPFFRRTNFLEFGKNANSAKLSVAKGFSSFDFNLFGDNWGLRFSVRRRPLAHFLFSSKNITFLGERTMKKILSILLLIAMLVPVFTSCNLIPSNEPEESSSQDSTPDTTITDTNNNNGNENTPPTTLTNEEKFNNASSLIAEGKYTEAYALLSEIKSYEPAKEKLKNFFYAPKTVDKKWKYSVE